MDIFLVDDSPAIRSRLAELLSAIPGAKVVGEAESAAGAIRDILALHPDAVLLDLCLGAGTSGFDVLRTVCPQEPEIDFYMLSNFPAEPYRNFALRLGARDFFDKSNEFGRMREVIAQRAAAHH